MPARDSTIAIWHVAHGTSYQPPIKAYHHGPVRSLIWVDYGLGSGNAFVAGHDLGYLAVYARTDKKVSITTSREIVIEQDIGPIFDCIGQICITSCVEHGLGWTQQLSRSFRRRRMLSVDSKCIWYVTFGYGLYVITVVSRCNASDAYNYPRP
jgi:hypothetical protein